MATSAKVALRPESEATRPFGKGRVTTNLINYGNGDSTSFHIRTQFLRARHIGDPVLSVLASLVWEVRRDD